jgi:hypothetical protein
MADGEGSQGSRDGFASLGRMRRLSLRRGRLECDSNVPGPAFEERGRKAVRLPDLVVIERRQRAAGGGCRSAAELGPA